MDDRRVRTVPPWVRSVSSDSAEPQSLLPDQARWIPVPKPKAARGRAFDHLRVQESSVARELDIDRARRWRSFVRASAYPTQQPRLLADEEWCRENLPDLEKPWNPAMFDHDNKSKRPWLLRRHNFRQVLMDNPFVPAIVRMVVLAFAATALGLGAQIYQDARRDNRLISNMLTAQPQHNARMVTMDISYPVALSSQLYGHSSSLMAIIGASIAIVYLFYATFDEYFSKPIGLRSPRNKMRVLFLDLLFIVLSSANCSLAFATLSDWESGPVAMARSSLLQKTGFQDHMLRERQRALCAILVIILVAWLMTFAISVLRVVERLQR